MSRNRSVIDYVWKDLTAQIDGVKQSQDSFRARAERSETTGGMTPSLLAAAPMGADGAANGDVLYIVDGCKLSEGTGLGTGVPAYYDEQTDSWLRFSDDTAVTV